MHCKNRLVAMGCLIALLIVAVVPAAAWGGDKPALSLEQAIRAVRDNLEVPAEFTEFTSSFENFNSHETWSLNWNAKEEPGGSFAAQVDANTGQIMSMNTWRNTPGSVPVVPVLSRSEAREKAATLLQRLAPQQYPDLRLLDDNDQMLVPLGAGYPTVYSFRWQRVNQGVPFPENGAYIEIRTNDGQVSAYNLNWSTDALPEPKNVIGIDKAGTIFNEAGMLELQYYSPPTDRPRSSDEQPQVMLVYQLHHSSGGLINAVTGELLESPWSGYYDYGMRAGGGGGDMSLGNVKLTATEVAKPVTPLSPEEQQEIEKTAGVISKEEALKAAQKWVEIPNGLTLNESRLVAEASMPGSRFWNLAWRSDDNSKQKFQYISVQVDAKTGELVSMNTSHPRSSETGLMNRQEASQIAATFLKRVQPGRFLETKLDGGNTPPRVYSQASNETLPVIQSFWYYRMVNGIPFINDGMRITIDTTEKSVVDFQLTWRDPNFPSKDGVLNGQQATEAYLKSQPITLCYYRQPDSYGKGPVQLVYQPLAESDAGSSGYMDARTGQMLDYMGKPVSEKKAVRFNDIDGHFAAEEINTVGQAGLFCEYGQAFHPDEPATMAVLLGNMLRLNGNDSSLTNLSPADVLKRARAQGWLKEDVQPNDPVTRENLAKIMIRFLKLERVAKATGIFQIIYADADSVPQESLGYIALANGLGILKGSGANFDPAHEATRAEAAAALVRTLKAQP